MAIISTIYHCILILLLLFPGIFNTSFYLKRFELVLITLCMKQIILQLKSDSKIFNILP